MQDFKDIKINLSEIDLDNKSLLRVSIDNRWSSSDFSLFFKSINTIYKSKFLTYRAIREVINFITNPENKNITFSHSHHTPIAVILQSVRQNLKIVDEETLSTYLRILPPTKGKFHPDELVVNKITYSSPGFTDFLGIAGILKEVKEAIIYYFPNRNDKEKYEILKQERIELQIKNLKAIGFSDIEIRTILLREDVKFEKISKFIEQGLITNIEIIDNKN